MLTAFPTSVAPRTRRQVEPVEWTAVVVAVVMVLPSTLVALRAWRSAEAANQEVQGNGRGSHTVMLEHLIDWTEEHDEKHSSMARSQDDLLRTYRWEQEALRRRLVAMEDSM